MLCPPNVYWNRHKLLYKKGELVHFISLQGGPLGYSNSCDSIKVKLNRNETNVNSNILYDAVKCLDGFCLLFEKLRQIFATDGTS